MWSMCDLLVDLQCFLTYSDSLAALGRLALEGAGFVGTRRGGAGLQQRRLQCKRWERCWRRGTQALTVHWVCINNIQTFGSTRTLRFYTLEFDSRANHQKCKVVSPGSPIGEGDCDGDKGDGFTGRGEFEGDRSDGSRGQGDWEGERREGSRGPGEGSLWEPLLHLWGGTGALWPSGISRIWTIRRETGGQETVTVRVNVQCG